MKLAVFLPQAKDELKQKLNRLVMQSIQLERKPIDHTQPIWSANFFNVENSVYWTQLTSEQKNIFLVENSNAILHEAIAIEHAGIAYAHKMALQSKTQEERNYYTTVALEELKHLLWLQPYGNPTELIIPSFANMVADIISTEDRESLLLLIQVFLEGWGIQYYSILAASTTHTDIKNIFIQILKDESRHHAGGIILFKEAEIIAYTELLNKVQRLVDTLRIGPYQVARSLAILHKVESAEEIESILDSIDCQQSTKEKLSLVRRILAKSLSAENLEALDWQPFNTKQMAELILSSLCVVKSPNQSIEISF